MIDPNYYNTYKIQPTLPVLSMYQPFNYQNILNLFTILQKMDEVYKVRGIMLVTFIVTLSSL